MKSLYHNLGQLKAKRVVVALDSCFSGAGGRSVLASGVKPLVTKLDLPEMASGNIILKPKVQDAARLHNHDQTPELAVGPEASAQLKLR